MAMTDNTARFRAIVQILLENEQPDDNNIRDGRNFVAFRSTKELPPSPNYGIYARNTREILEDIVELRKLVMDKRRSYILCGGPGVYSLYGGHDNFMNDSDRSAFDKEIDFAVKQCTRLIKEFEVQIHEDRTLRRADEKWHFQYIAKFLKHNLKEVCATITQLRQIYMRKSMQIRKICRLANLVEMYESRVGAITLEEQAKKVEFMKRIAALNSAPTATTIAKVKTEASTTDGWDVDWDVDDSTENKVKDENFKEADDKFRKPKLRTQNDERKGQTKSGINGLKPRAEPSTSSLAQAEKCHVKITENKENEPSVDGSQAEYTLSKYEQMQLIAENEALFDRVGHSDRELDRIESHLAEIQHLQYIFAEKVVEQEQDIDLIHAHTVTTLENIETANQFIRQAIENQANRRVIILFCLIVLSFTLLFLDWYNP